MMSPIGTFRTWRDVRLESAFRGKAEVGLRGRQGGRFSVDVAEPREQHIRRNNHFSLIG
jgi:hypothetical protein